MTSAMPQMVDDRIGDGVFRVDRSVYTDPAIFETEMAKIFEGNWVYLCHESQIAKPGDYFSTEIGREPVFVIRKKDGGIACFLNACSHRGAVLTPFKQGNANVLTCRFHGWAYASDGTCIKTKNEESGWPAETFDRSCFNLTPVACVESYRGFVYGSLNADIAPLDAFLGASRAWIDLLVEQSTEGLEVVPGSATYTIRGNWKLQAENSVDGYHVSTVHRVFAATISARESKAEYTGIKKTESGRITGSVPSAAYDLGNGHMAIWAQHTTPEVRPIWERKDDLERRLTPAQVKWILTRGRNLYLFPNMMLMDNPSTQIRVLKPIAADRAEVTVYCIAPKGESQKARIGRLRKFEDFYLTTGMATSDDVAALEDCHDGSHAALSRWNDFNRGMHAIIQGADEDAKALGFTPAACTHNWDHETLFHGFYRHWQALMNRDVPARPPRPGANGKGNGSRNGSAR
ncbi:MAG: Rieske 2Fe-2S domain-containing protein [Alphaproteobacteria bacterium]|nr:Rieske 2Fe-2S domain-containing protein [Alphaproteobacteria bacterium]